MTETLNQGPSVPALAKGMEILELLAEQRTPLSLQEISARLHRSRGELYRMITWLVDQRYVIRPDTSDTYILGDRIGRFFRRQPVIEDVISLAMPIMTEISTSVGFACHLSVRAERTCVVVAATESNERYDLTAKIGGMMPVWESVAAACLIDPGDDADTFGMSSDVDPGWKTSFEAERAHFARTGYVIRYGAAGLGLLECAFTTNGKSRLKSAIIATNAVASPAQVQSLLSHLKALASTSIR